MIARDTTATGAVSTGTSLVFSHTMGTGTAGIILVNLTITTGASFVVTTATYGGQALSKIIDTSEGAVEQIIYYLYAPPTGANNVIFDWTGTVVLASAVSASYLGASVPFPEVGVSSNKGLAGGGTGNVTVTTLTNNDWVIFMTSIKDGITQTPGANTIQNGGNSNGAWVWDTDAAVTPPGLLTQSASWNPNPRDFVATQFAMAPYNPSATGLIALIM